MSIFIGCAGWTLRKEHAAHFPSAGTHLERYAGRLNCVEINSSFYRSHRMRTYQRWAESTPSGFRFAVKLPKQVTHVRRLVDVRPQVEQFLAETSGLGDKLGPILVQLPPSLEFDAPTIEGFFRDLRAHSGASIVCEPRHSSWFRQDAEALMEAYMIDRVAADPSIVPEAAVPGGCRQDCYFRWHGSPRTYYSAYDEQALGTLARQLLAFATRARSVWCIFDNTAEGAALTNALALDESSKRGTSISRFILPSSVLNKTD
jgi:uncharacterized protein YecE (DUF72 family)